MEKSQSMYQADSVCKVLIQNKLLAANRAREILRQKDGLLDKLEKIRQKKYTKTPAAALISNPLTIGKKVCIFVNLLLSFIQRCL